jgi:ketosteroid isomerase-like protein
MTPKQVVHKWVEVFNKGNAETLAELYHSNAINHQVADDPVEGREAIRSMFEREFSQAEMVCITENIFEDGEWAILEWSDPLGLRGCGFFHIKGEKNYFSEGILG